MWHGLFKVVRDGKVKTMFTGTVKKMKQRDVLEMDHLKFNFRISLPHSNLMMGNNRVCESIIIN